MAATCARCGAQNPDGNLYCQNCGNQLTAAPGGVATAVAPSSIPGPPVAFAPPPAYQSPYYAPSGPAVPVHRTPWTMIIAGVVVLTLFMAGCGTALAVLGSRNSSANTNGGTIGALPSPSPFTATPIASPASTTSTTQTTVGVQLTVPPGWTVQAKDSESIVLTDPDNSGSVTLSSGISNPTQTAQDNKATTDSFFKSKYPDTRNCPGTAPANTTFNGASGISWTLCFTLTSGSQSVPAAVSLFAGANKDGSVYYLVMVATRQSNLQNYLNVAKPVLQGVKWKLS